MGVGPADFASQPLLPVSTWLLLSYKSSVQPVYRQFSMMVVVPFSCNFDVVMGGGEHSIDLLCPLNWKPPDISSFHLPFLQ